LKNISKYTLDKLEPLEYKKSLIESLLEEVFSMEDKHDFFPSGAVAFFLFMVAFYAFIWLLSYLVLLARG